MSFKGKETLSLIAGTGKELPDNIIADEKGNALKSIVVYGANASGKSNLIKAFAAAVMMIRESAVMQVGQPLMRVVPFKFDETSKDRATSFEFIFVTDRVKYVYGFSATTQKITEEYLYAYYSARPTTIYERVQDSYVFKADRRILDELVAKNSENKLFLSTAATWNYERVQLPFLWFARQIDIYAGNNWLQDYPAFMNDPDNAQKRFTTTLLRIADINICDYVMQEVDIPREHIEALRNDPMLRAFLEQTSEGLPTKGYSTTAVHNITNKERTIHYTLDLMEESQGTLHLFFMSSHLKQAFEHGKIMVVDEFDAGLHPLLLEEIVRMFHNPSINTGNAQLVFTTHAINLLDLETFRRDQVFFTEKNGESAASEIFALDEFSVRKSENIRNGYMYGRYGAIPMIAKGSSPWV
jgi:AAA15 family ATPase/GTPase